MSFTEVIDSEGILRGCMLFTGILGIFIGF